MMEERLDQLRSGLKVLRNTLFPGEIILMYHRVAELPNDPWLMNVSPEHFRQQLDVLKQYTEPVELARLVDTPRAARGSKPRVAITFDDGYDDNFINAKPLLETFDIPATFFIATGGIDATSEFWWDELDRLLLQPGALPSTLCLTIDDQEYHWHLGNAAEYQQISFDKHRPWRATIDDDPTPRHAIYCELYELLRLLDHDNRLGVMEQLQVWAGADTARRLSHQSMSHDQLASFARHGLIDIGAHTVNHPHLGAQPVERQRLEIEQAKARLQEIVGTTPESFAYPHGHYSPATVSLVQQAGFQRACNSAVDMVRPRSHRYQLPRVEVNDWDGNGFTQWLRSWISLAA